MARPSTALTASAAVRDKAGDAVQDSGVYGTTETFVEGSIVGGGNG